MVNNFKLCLAAIGVSGISLSILIARYYQEYYRNYRIQQKEVVEELSKDDQIILFLKKYILDQKNIMDFKKMKLDIQQLEIPHKQFQIYKFNLIDSTMSLCENFPKLLIDNDDLYVFISDQQSQGIGQRENKWLSPVGNIYLTILQKIQPNLLQYMSLASAKSVFNAIEEYFLENGILTKSLTLKWVNDVYLDEKKVAGVLVQTQQLGKNYYMSVGIGVNVNVDPQVDNSTSIQAYLKRDKNIELQGIIVKIIKSFLKNTSELQRNGFANLKNEIQSYLSYINKEVVIYDHQLNNVVNQGVFIGINEDGNAILIVDNQKKIIYSGKMRLKQ